MIAYEDVIAFAIPLTIQKLLSVFAHVADAPQVARLTFVAEY
jgi:hypothetical protein